MVIQAAASVVAAILVAVSDWQYIAEVIRREAHPRLVSWAIWTVSLAIACAGAAMAGQLPAATLAGISSAGCLVVLVAGWQHGERDVGWLDVWCAAASGTGASLLGESVIWPGVVPVAVAIIASVVTDASAFLPTWRNAWRGNEPLRPYVIITGAAAVSLAASDMAVPAAVVFPMYETAADALAWLLIVSSLARSGRSRMLTLSGIEPPPRSVIPRLDSDSASDGTSWPARIARLKAYTAAGSVHWSDPDVICP